MRTVLVENQSIPLMKWICQTKSDSSANGKTKSENIVPDRNSADRDGQDNGLATATDKPKLAQPPLYKVVLINDDYTPMDFVVDILRSFFDLNVEKATQIMLKVHTEGKGVCGVFSKDVAETKAAQVNDYSRECEQPLLCSVEIER